MPARLSLDEVSARVRELWDGVATLDESTFVDLRTPARFIDRDYGEWWAKPFHLMKGTGRHPIRARANTISARKLTAEEVDFRTRERHDQRVVLRKETYRGTHVKALFVDIEHGEWWAQPYSVMSGRGHPRGRLKKAIATMRSFEPVIHWKTGDVCYPSSGFEHAVLTWLNAHAYDFAWQVPFEMPVLTPKLGRPVIYNVDFYVKSGPFADTYIEVKGTWSRRTNSDGGKAKWQWFHATYPNSQLWMRDDLQRLGIIDAQRAYLEKARNDV